MHTKTEGEAMESSDGLEYQALIFRDEASGWYVADVPDLPGCMSQGSTREEARDNVRESIRGYLAVLRMDGREIPKPTHLELVSVAV
jgi:predicted RNase H-like HicB family nuclease